MSLVNSVYFLAALHAGLLGVAWWLPGTAWGAVFGWLSCVPLVLITIRNKKVLSSFYLAGILFQPLGFYWLWTTISDFGGFKFVPTLAIFLFYVVISAIQYGLAAFLFQRLPTFLDRFSLRLALAWVVSEQLSIRIFPWYVGHTQLGFPLLAQSADLLGAPLITLLMFATTQVLLSKPVLPLKSAPILALIGLLIYGQFRLTHFQTAQFPTAPVALVQANISLEEKHSVKNFKTNVRRYVDLSLKIERPGTIVIWPETVLTDWIYARSGSVQAEPRVPFLGKKLTLVTGALSFSSREEIHNSAIVVLEDGSLPVPYHKMLLMPFGEYTPLSGIFPWLKDINVTAGDFTAGAAIKVFEIPASNDRPQVNLSALICYEDVVDYLARDAVKKGATLLVNLTNDAWFGKSVASAQHHQIAAFRALETRRTLLRSTNTGLTAIVLPNGETVSTLAPFSEGYLEREVPLLTETTLFVSIGADKLWLFLSILLACLVVLRGAIFSGMRKSILILPLCLLVACANPEPGPDKTVGGAVLGAAWGAGSGMIVANQVDATAGQGALVGGGLGAVSGAMSGLGYDMNEDVLIDQEKQLASLRAHNMANAREISTIQASLDRAIVGGLVGGIYQVYFDADQTNLRSGAIANLEIVGEGIKRNSSAFAVTVVGHADDGGSPQYNERLAEARARTVASYLGARGISMDQITVRNFGSKRPIASNSTESGRQLNRRVDVIVSQNRFVEPATSGTDQRPEGQ